MGDPHGDLGRVKRIPVKNTDLILLAGDLGKADLMRQVAFENIERKKKGLKKIFHPSKEKKTFMEAYSSSVEIVKYLKKFAPVFTIYGNVESSNTNTRKEFKEIGLPLLF